MILGHTSPKLVVSINVVVLDSCEIIEPRKKQLKAEILHNLKEFYFVFVIFFAEITSIFKKHYSYK